LTHKIEVSGLMANLTVALSAWKYQVVNIGKEAGVIVT
jgi:hypothetical protein